MRLGTASVVRANSRHLPLPDNSVDLVVTSPPYFALRSYQDAGQHYEGQLGSETTPAEFVAALLEVTAECVRVLKPSGSLWVNLGDKYAGVNIGTTSGHQNGTIAASSYTRHIGQGRATSDGGVRPKSLIGIPWRYAIACIDQLGLILRAEVIWNKPNGLPESVTDRVRRSHEQWFHFTLQPRYYSAVDEIREPQLEPNRRGPDSGSSRRLNGGANQGFGLAGDFTREYNPLGKLPGSVWTIPTEPLQVPPHLGIDHFAAYPTEWPRRIIQGWSPTGICLECGEGRRPVIDKKPMEWRPGPKAGNYELDGTTRKVVSGTMLTAAETTITGYTCACLYSGDFDPIANSLSTDARVPPTRPAVVLDPFGGTGTTALVAKALGRHGITVDKSADYCRLAEWRVNDRDQLAKVLHIPRVGPPDTDQMTLFP